VVARRFRFSSPSPKLNACAVAEGFLDSLGRRSAFCVSKHLAFIDDVRLESFLIYLLAFRLDCRFFHQFVCHDVNKHLLEDRVPECITPPRGFCRKILNHNHVLKPILPEGIHGRSDEDSPRIAIPQTIKDEVP